MQALSREEDGRASAMVGWMSRPGLRITLHKVTLSWFQLLVRLNTYRLSLLVTAAAHKRAVAPA